LIKTGKSAGPRTPVGTVVLEDNMISVTYDTEGVSNTVYTNARELRGDRDTPPLPVMARNPAGTFVKVGYCCRSPSGRALIMNTSSSQGYLTIEWSALISVVRGERKRAMVSRLNAPMI
jgi:hypothetical protein